MDLVQYISIFVVLGGPKLGAQVCPEQDLGIISQELSGGEGFLPTMFFQTWSHTCLTVKSYCWYSSLTRPLGAQTFFVSLLFNQVVPSLHYFVGLIHIRCRTLHLTY